MTGNDTVLLPPSASVGGFFASSGGNHGAGVLSDLHNNSAIWNSSVANGASTERLGYALMEAVAQGSRDNLVETARTSGATQTAIEKAAGVTQVAVERIGAANTLAVEKIGAASVLAVEKTGAATVLAIAVNSASLQLEAQKSAAANLAAIAACCCELKEGQAATNALVREIDNNRVRDELSDAKSQVAILNLKASLLPVVTK